MQLSHAEMQIYKTPRRILPLSGSQRHVRYNIFMWTSPLLYLLVGSNLRDLELEDKRW